MMKQSDYKQDVEIDEQALDVEWLDQAKLVMKYSRIQAEAERAYKQAKSDLEMVEAELTQEISSNPDAFDLAKTTNKAIESALVQQPGYIEAKEDKLEAKYEYDMAQAAVNAMYSKKSALENLVKLHGQKYFAGPKEPRNLSKEFVDKKKQERANRNVEINRSK